MTTVSTSKRCGCRDETGRQLGGACPRLRRGSGWSPHHGTWSGKAELPPGPDGSREFLRAGGFARLDDLNGWFDAALALLAIPEQGPAGHTARAEIRAMITASRKARGPLPDAAVIRAHHQAHVALEPGLLGDFLARWIADRKAAGSLAPKTQHSYEGVITRLLVPELGHVPLHQLDAGHILGMLARIDERSDQITARKASDDPEVRAGVKGQVPAGMSTKKRYLAVLSSALSDAASPSYRLVPSNVALTVKIGTRRTRGSARSRAKLWTQARVQEWDADLARRAEAANVRGSEDRYHLWMDAPSRPGRVMIWTPAQTGRFLDAAAGDPLYPLFCLICYCGLRRGEACGLRWEDADLDGGAITVASQIVTVGWAAVTTEVKTDSSLSIVRAAEVTIEALRARRRAQAKDRLALGAAWPETGLAFTRPDGAALHPEYVAERFTRIAFREGLPPITPHGGRHGAATIALAGGADITAVSRMLRHGSIQVTADFYAEVLPELAAETARTVESMVCRKGQSGGRP